MQKSFLSLFFLLFLFGCAAKQNNYEISSANLDTRAFLVSYIDSKNPYPEQDVAINMNKLNEFIVRNSTGKNSVTFDIVSISLSGSKDDYMKGQYWINGYPRQDHNTQLQQDCLNSFQRKRYNIYLLPADPILDFGFKDGNTFLSAAEPIETLPFAHEFGHMLGLPHTSEGVMIGPPMIPVGITIDQAGAMQRDWNGWYDQKSREKLGWL